MRKKGQGALEYLLLIGGAVLVSGFVLVMVLGVGGAGGGQAKSAVYNLAVKKMPAMYGSSAVSYWGFDEGSGLAAKNGFGSSYGLSGVSGWSGGKFGGGIDSTGFASGLSAGNIPGLAGNLTLSYWFYPADYASGRQNALDKSYGGEFAITHELGGAISYYQGQSASNYGWCSAAGFVTQNNTWYHIAMVRDVAAQTVKIYKNGQPVTVNCPVWVAPSLSASPVLIGKGYAGTFRGKIDEVMIFSTALSADEIKILAG